MTGNVASGREAHLRELADGALCRAAWAARADGKVHPPMRELMRQLCAVAHERELRAEQLILLIKDAWRTLPEARRLPRHDAGEALARAITVCIEEFFPRGDVRLR